MGHYPDAAIPLRIGLFGGTFDPPHLGHTAVAADVANALELDQVLWIPAGHPPHKPLSATSPVALRLEMTRAAVGVDSRFKTSGIEAESLGPSYTVETARALKEHYPETILFLIIGTDQFRQFDMWRNPEELLRLVELVVMDRGGLCAQDHIPCVDGTDKAHFISVRKVEISSTDVRAAVSDKQDVSALVPAGVAEIIFREGLYMS